MPHDPHRAPAAPRRQPALFIPHGGGPWPWIAEQAGVYAALAAFLRELPATLPARPAAVLMVSAHWEEPRFTVMTHPRPPMLYDYGGFPEHTYRIRYEAPGAPALAARALALLGEAGIEGATDAERGFDHGLFVPMAMMYPDADVPVMQLSLKQGLDPAAHLAAGRALAPLREEGVLIVGSGYSFHNLRLWGAPAREPSALFDRWLQEAMALPDAGARAAALTAWAGAPAARIAHPREEHLLPLMVAAGAALDDPPARIFHEGAHFGFASVSGFGFGMPASAAA